MQINNHTFIQVLHLLALIGGVFLIGLYSDSNSIVNGIGGTTIGVAAIVSIYEIIMIGFALQLIKGVNHPARLAVVSIVYRLHV